MQWFLLENEEDYNKAVSRYEEIYEVEPESKYFKEYQLLGHLISEYEKRNWDLHEIDPIKAIRIRMKEFGYKATDFVDEMGDKGNLSKVLNYKRPLSLQMIRKFSEMLKIPTDLLLREYKLK